MFAEIVGGGAISNFLFKKEAMSQRSLENYWVRHYKLSM